jgi:hypothetical protein
MVFPVYSSLVFFPIYFQLISNIYAGGLLVPEGISRSVFSPRGYLPLSI